MFVRGGGYPSLLQDLCSTGKTALFTLLRDTIRQTDRQTQKDSQRMKKLKHPKKVSLVRQTDRQADRQRKTNYGDPSLSEQTVDQTEYYLRM